jgi:methionyl-tRNA formyltransferase
MKDGASLLVQTVDAIAEGNYSKGTTQDKMEMDYSLDDLKPAPKIFKEDCKINWNKPAEQVRNFIRGLSPYPAAWTVLQNNEGKKLTLKIYGSIVKSDIHLSPGEMRVENSIHIYIGCADAALEITELQLEGRKTMPVADFLRGFRMEEEGWAIVEGIK